MRFPLIDMTEGFARAALRPEERLLLAVVDSAYWDLRSPDPIRRKTASQYFLAEDHHHTFSFVSICQHFSWSPTSIRTQLGTWLSAVPALSGEDIGRRSAEVRHVAGSAGR
ncbi:hypothetical protein L6Q96_13180 [Candidatus Binatia bacterium]|nr:hypothetical protein [Candidatus Binatia bacterium]